jgi:hypothetical protein
MDVEGRHVKKSRPRSSTKRGPFLRASLRTKGKRMQRFCQIARECPVKFVARSIRTFSVHTVARALEHGGFVAVREKGSHRRDRRDALHPRHRHDLDDFYPCAGVLQMGMVLAEYLRGRIMRFGLHNRIAADLIFCI